MGILGGLLDAVGIDLTTWALLLVLAWYLFRGQRGAKRAGSFLSRVITWLVIVLVTGAIAAALGWADLHVSTFIADAGAAIGWLLDEGLRVVTNLISGVLS